MRVRETSAKRTKTNRVQRHFRERAGENGERALFFALKRKCGRAEMHPNGPHATC